MKKKTKKQEVSLNITWRENDDSNALAAMLINNGAKGVRIYEYPYLDDSDAAENDHKNTEFLIRSGDDYPLWQILADIATHPSVLSVGEKEDQGFFERIVRCFFR